LNELQATIADLNVTLQQLKSSNADTDVDNSDKEEHLLERDTVQLDGLELYAVVRALTSTTLCQGFDDCTPHSCDEMALVHLIGDFFFFLRSSSWGVVACLHAILVFSLITLYGRTANGMGWDNALRSLATSTRLPLPRLSIVPV
jgi:hypothetical protein